MHQRNLVCPETVSLCLAVSALLWVSFFLREILCLSGQVGQRIWPSIAGFGQLLQRPRDLAIRLRSPALFLVRLYSRRCWNWCSRLTGVLALTGCGSGLGFGAGRGLAGVLRGFGLSVPRLALFFLCFPCGGLGCTGKYVFRNGASPPVWGNRVFLARVRSRRVFSPRFLCPVMCVE